MSTPPNAPYAPYGGAPFPPPVPRKKKKPMLAGCLGCLGLLVAALLTGGIVSAITGGGTNKPTTLVPAPPSSAPAGTAAKKPVKHAGIGHEVRDGKFAFTVTKVMTGIGRVGDENVGQNAQGQYVEVQVNVANISTEPQTFSGSDQKLIVGNQQYDADAAAAMYLKDSRSLYEPINPGNAVAGTILFDLPRGAKPTKIELHDSPFSGGVTVSLQ